MWFKKKPRGAPFPGASCCRCTASEDAKLVNRQERVGCLVSSFTYCESCLKLIEEEENSAQHQKSHFCNICKVEFQRPYAVNRKRFLVEAGFMSYSMNLCSSCYESELAKAPKREPEPDPWGAGTVGEDINLW